MSSGFHTIRAEGWITTHSWSGPSGECPWCKSQGQAVQDDGLDVETLRRALNDYDAFVGFREDDGRDVTVKDRHEWAERWVNRLRAAPPLHDPQEPE